MKPHERRQLHDEIVDGTVELSALSLTQLRGLMTDFDLDEEGFSLRDNHRSGVPRSVSDSFNGQQEDPRSGQSDSVPPFGIRNAPGHNFPFGVQEDHISLRNRRAGQAVQDLPGKPWSSSTRVSPLLSMIVG